MCCQSGAPAPVSIRPLRHRLGAARIARFTVPNHPPGGRPRPAQRRPEYVDAIRYVLPTGCAWRHLPHDCTLSWCAAHKHFLRWCRAGTWTTVLTAIRGEVRTRSGPRRRPTAAVVDSSSITPSPVAGPRGLDGANKVDGVKRHVLVDFAGLLVAAVLTAADVQDRAAALRLLGKAKRVAPTITHVWMDNGYTAPTGANAAKAGVHVDVVSGPKPGHGFIVDPRRWVVECTNGWINHCRRLDRHYQVTLAAHEGSLILSQIALLLRRLDSSQLFDTL
jgi:transposase